MFILFDLIQFLSLILVEIPLEYKFCLLVQMIVNILQYLYDLSYDGLPVRYRWHQDQFHLNCFLSLFSKLIFCHCLLVLPFKHLLNPHLQFFLLLLAGLSQLGFPSNSFARFVTFFAILLILQNHQNISMVFNHSSPI